MSGWYFWPIWGLWGFLLCSWLVGCQLSALFLDSYPESQKLLNVGDLRCSPKGPKTETILDLPPGLQISTERVAFVAREARLNQIHTPRYNPEPSR